MSKSIRRRCAAAVLAFGVVGLSACGGAANTEAAKTEGAKTEGATTEKSMSDMPGMTSTTAAGGQASGTINCQATIDARNALLGAFKVLGSSTPNAAEVKSQVATLQSSMQTIATAAKQVGVPADVVSAYSATSEQVAANAQKLANGESQQQYVAASEALNTPAYQQQSVTIAQAIQKACPGFATN